MRARADEGHGNRLAPQLHRLLETRGVGGAQEDLLARVAAHPFGPHGVNHKAAREAVSLRDLHLSHTQGGDGDAFRVKLSARRPMDGEIRAPPADHLSVGGIHDGVRHDASDVLADDGKGHGLPSSLVFVTAKAPSPR